MQKADPLGWLPERDEANPSGRDFALTGLLDLPADAPEVVKAQRAVMASGPAPARMPAAFGCSPAPVTTPSVGEVNRCHKTRPFTASHYSSSTLCQAG